MYVLCLLSLQQFAMNAHSGFGGSGGQGLQAIRGGGGGGHRMTGTSYSPQGATGQQHLLPQRLYDECLERLWGEIPKWHHLHTLQPTKQLPSS